MLKNLNLITPSCPILDTEVVPQTAMMWTHKCMFWSQSQSAKTKVSKAGWRAELWPEVTLWMWQWGSQCVDSGVPVACPSAHPFLFWLGHEWPWGKLAKSPRKSLPTFTSSLPYLSWGTEHRSKTSWLVGRCFWEIRKEAKSLQKDPSSPRIP